MMTAWTDARAQDGRRFAGRDRQPEPDFASRGSAERSWRGDQVKKTIEMVRYLGLLIHELGAHPPGEPQTKTQVIDSQYLN